MKVYIIVRIEFINVSKYSTMQSSIVKVSGDKDVARNECLELNRLRSNEEVARGVVYFVDIRNVEGTADEGNP